MCKRERESDVWIDRYTCIYIYKQRKIPMYGKKCDDSEKAGVSAKDILPLSLDLG